MIIGYNVNKWRPTIIGESINISCDVNNFGVSDLVTITSWLKVYLSADAVINEGTDPLLFEYSFSDLASGDTLSFAENVTIAAGYPSGNVNILFVVDRRVRG